MRASMPPFPDQERGPCPTPRTRALCGLLPQILVSRDQRFRLRDALCAVRSDSATFFFLPTQCALDAARMGRYGEALLNGSGQIQKAEWTDRSRGAG